MQVEEVKAMDNDEWLRMQNEIAMADIAQMKPETTEPIVDPDEPWSELPPLTKISPGVGFDLVVTLRKAGLAVRGDSKSAGFFSKKVNLTLKVPTRMRAEAEKIVKEYFETH